MNHSDMVLWAYIVLLVAGGLIGFLKAGSKVSLIASAAFAILLVLCAVQALKVPHLADILLGLLVAVFALRVAKTRKFMPSGLLLSLTACALLLRFLLK